MNASSGLQSLTVPDPYDSGQLESVSAHGEGLVVPVPTVSGTAEIASVGTGDAFGLTVPAPVVTAQGVLQYANAWDGTGDFHRLPVPEVAGSLLPGRAFTTGSMALPGIEQSDGQGGASGENTLPAVEVEGTAAFGRVFENGINVLPAPALEAQADGAGIFQSGELALPVPRVAGELIKGGVATGGGTLTAPTVEGVMLSGTVAVSGDMALPVPTVTGTLYAIVVITSGNLTVPVPILVAAELLPPAHGPPVAPSEAMALVMNARTGALSRYDAFAFNSFALVGGMAYAAGAGGIYRLEGPTDEGAPIAAQITQPPTDFGLPQLKRMVAVYVTYRSAGPLELSTTLDDAVTYCYRMDETKPAGLYRNRTKMGRGAKAALWQLDVQNVDGADFTLQAVEPVYEALGRRLS